MVSYRQNALVNLLLDDLRQHCPGRIRPSLPRQSPTTTSRDSVQITTRHEGCALSQRKRKRIEEIFCWMKMMGPAYNLLRMTRPSKYSMKK